MKQVVSIILTCILLLTACGQSTPTWQEQYDLGVRYLSEGNYEEAIIAFTAAIEIDPKQAPAYVGRGDAYIGSGETEENLAAALADYEKAVELDETCAEGYLGIADVYIRQGEFDKALEILKTGLEKTGDDQSIADKIAEMENGTYQDAAGKLRRRDGYYEGAAWYQLFQYDEQGRETGITVYDGQGNQTGHADVRYDGNGNEIESYGQMLDSGEVFPTKLEYDDDGNLIKLSTYQNGDGSLTNYDTYEYDQNERMIKTCGYNADGTLYAYTLYEYDENDNMTADISYDPNGTRSWYNLYQYDSDGRMIRCDSYEGSGVLNTYTLYEYMADGSYTASHYQSDGMLISQWTES